MNEPISNSAPDSQNALLQYPNQLLEPDELAELDALLQMQSYKLLHRDLGGHTYNVDPDFLAKVVLFLKQETVKDLLIGVAGGALWDAIKLAFTKIHGLVKNRTVLTMTSKSVTERSSCLSLTMPVQRGHNVEFKMDNMSEALIQESLDKSLSFLREQKASAVVLTEIDGVNANHPVQYNPQLKQWLRDETHPDQSYSRIVRTMSLEEYLRSMGHKE